MRDCTSVFKTHHEMRNLEGGGLVCSLLNGIEIAEYLVLTEPCLSRDLKGFHKINHI